MKESNITDYKLKRHSKWFEPRSISRSHSVIVWVRVVLKRTVVCDGCFDNLSGSYSESSEWYSSVDDVINLVR